MRHLLRNIIFNAVVLYLLSHYSTALQTNHSSAVILGAIMLGLLEYAAKPIVKLLWLPVNLLSLGLLSWVPFMLILLLALLLTPGMAFHNLIVPKLDFWIIHTPNLHFGPLFSAILFTFTFLFLRRLLRWATR